MTKMNRVELDLILKFQSLYSIPPALAQFRIGLPDMETGGPERTR